MNHQGLNDFTPLDLAIHTQYPEVERILLDQGAKGSVQLIAQKRLFSHVSLSHYFCACMNDNRHACVHLIECYSFQLCTCIGMQLCNSIANASYMIKRLRNVFRKIVKNQQPFGIEPRASDLSCQCSTT